MATAFTNDAPEYAALIRTFNSESTLPVTLACLKRQTNPPRHYIIVDSGSTDQTLACVPPGSLVHRYVGSEFNFSEAINQGLKLVSSDYVLIISSHTELGNCEAMSYALGLLKSDPEIGAAYFSHLGADSLRHELINQDNFTGFNGLWNTCAMIRVSLLRKRMFRPEVFSAEDQEWAGWLFANEKKAVARISGGGLTLHNPRMDSPRKKLNEYVAVAYFTNRKLLEWSNIGDLLSLAFTPGTGIGPAKRKFYFWLSVHLIACHFFKPRARSRYF